MHSSRSTSGFTRLISILALLMLTGGAFYYFANNKVKESTPESVAPAAVTKAPTPVAAAVASDPGKATPAVTVASAAPGDSTTKRRPPPQPIPVPIQMATPAKAPAAQGAVQAPPPMPKKVTFTLEDLKAQVPQDKNGNFQLELPELYMATGDRQVATVLDGQKVETIGRVLPEKSDNANGHKVRLFALVISCCAADAQPITIPIEFTDKAPVFKDMTWVKVQGVMRYKVADNDRLLPVLEAIKMEETESQDGKSLF